MTRYALSDPFVAAGPSAVSIRTSLRVSADEDAVLRSVGERLGSMVGAALAHRLRLGPGHKHLWRADIKRELTKSVTARQAGAITRRAADLYERGVLNDEQLLDRDLREVSEIDARAALPTLDTLGGGSRKGTARRGRKRVGYVSRDERFQKQRRAQKLRGRAARTRQRLSEGRPRVVIGGKKLLRKRHNLQAAGLSLEEWEQEWRARRLFLAADGETGKRHGNETIRVIPAGNGECELLLRLPKDMEHLSNTPSGPYLKISSPLRWNHRAGQWRNRAIAGEALTYQITYDTSKQRWYITSSWVLRPSGEDDPPTVEKITRSGNCMAIDLNAGNVAARVLDRSGNPIGAPLTVDIPQHGSSAQRLGRVREAVDSLHTWGSQHGATFSAVEKLDFSDIRTLGRQRGRRGRPGRTARRKTAGIPTRQFMAAMTSSADKHSMAMVAVDPAYTSRWGSRYWHQPLNQSRTQKGNRHEAAAVVIGRRSQGHHAKRRNGNPRNEPKDRPVGTTAEPSTTAHGMADQASNAARRAPPNMDGVRTPQRTVAQTAQADLNRSGRRDGTTFHQN
ncbi:hypothetical protein [Candidatus Poriferisodalis sp.]|uniref:hypothetical protein n=1 Tax=Candidatus Poriferisodalis sp. TaxID=3101277 RepID=UPI003C6FD884